MACIQILPLAIVPYMVFAADSTEDWTMQRNEMIKAIEFDMNRARNEIGKRELSEQTTEALRRVERHRFVPESIQSQAYINRPLPIGLGQTISQPFIVALMTELLDVDSTSRVLEVGTGSGYQAAVLAEIVAQVYTIEIVAELAQMAKSRLQKLGYDNITVKQGDGTKGWQEHAPFDGIIVTAAGIEIPDRLRQQLKPGGKMVMPVGPQATYQELIVITHQKDGTFTQERTIPVRFVPITH